ncbi:MULTISPECIES: hypothetical protein [Desulfotignum]
MDDGTFLGRIPGCKGGTTENGEIRQINFSDLAWHKRCKYFFL